MQNASYLELCILTPCYIIRISHFRHGLKYDGNDVVYEKSNLLYVHDELKTEPIQNTMNDVTHLRDIVLY